MRFIALMSPRIPIGPLGLAVCLAACGGSPRNDGSASGTATRAVSATVDTSAAAPAMSGESPGFSIAPGEAKAQPFDQNRALLEDERNSIDVYERTSQSVVYITNSERRRDLFSMNVMEVPRGTGSGFIWDAQGHVVTNYHVLEGGNTFSVTLADGNTYPATFRGGEPNKDIAVLTIDAPTERLHPVRLGDSADLRVGQKVLAIGNPFGLDQTLTTGVISALGREIRSGTGVTITDVIQTDASINPGNSGGALLDSSGELIGMNAAIISPSGSSAGIGFAVPVNTIKQLVPQLIELGHVRRAALGITRITDDLARRWGIQGVIVRDVIEGGAAADAGIRPLMVDRFGNVRSFDVITGIDDKPVHNYDDLYSALDRKEPGDEVEVRIRRGDRDVTLPVKLKELE